MGFQKTFDFKGSNSGFLIGRVSVSLLSLSLALGYSFLLGLEKRSVLSFVLVTSVFLASLFGSPLVFRYRFLSLTQLKPPLGINFAILALVVSFFVALLMVVVSWLYSSYVTFLATNLIIAIALYSFFSTLSFILHEFFIVKRYSRAYILMDVFIILMQISLFTFFLLLNQLSLIINVIVSLTLSYIFHSTIVLSLILYTSGDFPSMKEIGRLLEVRGYIVTANIVNVLDRVDKLFVAFLLPIGDLAKYLTCAALFAPFRFYFDAKSKHTLIVFDTKRGDVAKNKSRARKLIYSLALLFVYPYFVQAFLNLTLGDKWLLPIHFVYIYLLVELARGRFMQLLNSALLIDNIGVLRQKNAIFLSLSVVLIFISTLYFQLLGLFFSLFFVFLFLTRQLGRIHA